MNQVRQNGVFQWGEVISHLSNNPENIHGENLLRTIRQRLECDGAPLDVVEYFIMRYPKELAFSLFLCITRFPFHIPSDVVDQVLGAIEAYPQEQMDYCIAKFQGSKKKPKTADTVIGEAMTLIFSFFDHFVPSPESGNPRVIKEIRRKYPESILYIDAHEFTPLHGACCAMNLAIFRFFVEWHLEEKPDGRGGLYSMNDSGITSLDTFIDTQSDIIPALQWLQTRGLLKSKDVEEWLLIHRSAHSSTPEVIRFFINLYPSGVLATDDDGNLALHLHLGLRYRQRGTFSEKDFQIVKLFIKQGIVNGGIDTIGGLFHRDPDENHSTFDSLLKEVGEKNVDPVWQIVDECVQECGGYCNAPIVHAAILNRDIITDKLFKEVLDRYGVGGRNKYEELPLIYGIRIGAEWKGCISTVLEKDFNALNDWNNDSSADMPDPFSDRYYDSDLPLAAYAASQQQSDLNTIYELLRLSPNF
jgi:hypothetical protein